MAIKVKNNESKVVAAKRNITIEDAIVKELKFVDETGDITNDVLAQIPDWAETIDLKISIELPPDDNEDAE